MKGFNQFGPHGTERSEVFARSEARFANDNPDLKAVLGKAVSGFADVVDSIKDKSSKAVNQAGAKYLRVHHTPPELLRLKESMDKLSESARKDLPTIAGLDWNDALSGAIRMAGDNNLSKR